MEGFLILLLVILPIIIVIVPIILWVKLIAVGSRIDELKKNQEQLKDIGNEITRILTDGTKTAIKPETEASPTPAEQPEAIPGETDIPVAIVEEPVPDIVASEPEEEPQEEVQETVEAPVEIENPVPAYAATEVPEEKEIPVFSMPQADDETLTADLPPVREKAKKAPVPYHFENLLSKIGIVTLVLGIAFFVKYAIDKDWINEVGRVAIGVLVGGILIGIAHKLREKYNVFSALMVGGGISVLYITITLAFREYHLFNQTLAFIILIAITLFSVILSLLYNRKELALFSLLGGYASPLMISTGEGNYIVLFSFILILNCGMLLISMYKKWGIIGIVSFVCTQLFYWMWLLHSFIDQYAGALVFISLFFVQFYLLALFDHFLSDRKISPFQVVLILTNNLSVFAASIYIFDGTGMKVQGLITMSIAIINAIVMIGLFRKASVDKRLIYLIIAIVLSFVSLTIPVQLNGHVITMFWAAEIVILLMMWKKTGIKVFYFGFLLISALTLISYMIDAYHIYFELNDRLPVIFNRIFMTGLVVIAAFVVSKLLLSRMDDNRDGIINHDILKRVFTSVILVISYIVPFLEILFQFVSSPVEGISAFTLMMLTIYTTIYVAVLSCIYRKSIQDGNNQLMALFFFIALYLVFALPVMINLRGDVFRAGKYEALFAIHYLSLPALVSIFYVIAGNIRKCSKQVYTVCGWLLVVFAVVILSVELDNTVLQLWGTTNNYRDLLFDAHTFGYPILWGILAMILMIWGLKAKEALLRQISLGFFGFIILKFYISDIWLMSQTGRIISFVVLGVILLLVSFLIQKIKVLIKDDEESTDSEQEN